MARRALIWGALACAAAGLVLAGACEDSDTTPAARGGAVAGTGGGGGTLSDAGADRDADGGEGGAGGQGSDPEWEIMPETIAGCTVERVANAPEVRAFTWQSCGPAAGCQQMALLDAWRWENQPLSSGRGRVQQTAEGVVAALDFNTGSNEPERYYLVLIMHDDGWLIDGYRARVGEEQCKLSIPTLSNSRYGFVVESGGVMAHRIGGILRPLDQSEPAVPFEVVPAPPGVGPQIWRAMSETRWMWQFHYDTLRTISAIDGSDLQTVAEASPQGPLIGLNCPATDGSKFLFMHVERVGNDPQWTIAQSNGSEPPTPYLEPSDDSDFGPPGYAHSHVAWMRGFGQTDLNVFTTVELWASEYDADPAALSPYKVDDWDFTSLSLFVTAGHGRFAKVGVLSEDAVWVWDLVTTQRQEVPFVPNRLISALLGLTPDHIWAVGSPPSEQWLHDTIVRLPLD